MSFVKNPSQQLCMNDPLIALTDHQRKRLEHSWAKEFGDTVFPMINEERFSVLYSENPASRPNSPINVMFGLLILKTMFGQSDEEALDSLFFDIRYQYALHTTSMKEQPLSKHSLSNFRRAIYAYAQHTGRDLIQEEVEAHAENFRELLCVDGNSMRMDSMMISSSCRSLTRLELVYACVSRMLHTIATTNSQVIPDSMKDYLREGHQNEVIYHSKQIEVKVRLEHTMKDAKQLLKQFAGEELSQTEDYCLLKRMVQEQTEEREGKRQLRPAKEVQPESLQNPTDPDAAYRTKDGKKYVGYVGNLKEDFNQTDSVILQYDLQKATYSDQAFTKDMLEKLAEQTEERDLLVDGAYYSDATSIQAKKQGIRLIPSGLVGREPKGDYSTFEIDERTHTVKQCVQGNIPIRQQFKKGIYKAYFDKEDCGNCPYRTDCPVLEQKRHSMLKMAETQYHLSKVRQEMKRSEYRKRAMKRAGIEGLPSLLRRSYHMDHLPVRGLVRVKTWFGFGIEAINVFRYIKRDERHRRQQRKAFRIHSFLWMFTRWQCNVLDPIKKTVSITLLFG